MKDQTLEEGFRQQNRLTNAGFIILLSLAPLCLALGYLWRIDRPEEPYKKGDILIVDSIKHGRTYLGYYHPKRP